MRDVHLVGSVPLASARDVFVLLSEHLGPLLKRVPDGETGARAGWVAGQYRRVLAGHPAFEPAPVAQGRYQALPPLRVRPGFDKSALKFPSLGYAHDVIHDSYPVFLEMRATGEIHPHQRMLVPLPTPIATVAGFVVPEDQIAVEPAYERALLREVAEIESAIPPADLAFQWDVAREFMLVENLRPSPYADLWGGLGERLARYAAGIPHGAEVGFHLCYGNQGQRHFIEPRDSGNLVRVANLIAARVDRRVAFVHMPVPRDRDDDAYFAPMADLKLPADTDLALGLLHIEDGVEGARRRINAASRYRRDFGVAAECGLGGRPKEQVTRIIELHSAVARSS